MRSGAQSSKTLGVGRSARAIMTHHLVSSRTTTATTRSGLAAATRRRSAASATHLPSRLSRRQSSSPSSSFATNPRASAASVASPRGVDALPSAPALADRGASHIIKYEVVKGTLVQFSDVENSGVDVPTAVLVHGILGSSRNLRGFARKLARENPAWQFVLVDLRCHGDSSSLSSAASNSVDGAAADVLSLLKKLNLFPKMLIGHSFGGKVVMKMVDRFGSRALPRPVQVWVLDTVPGDVKQAPGAGDHPRDLIERLLQFPLPIRSPNMLVRELSKDGFSFQVAAWVATNLVVSATGEGYTWVFDLQGIKQMYQSYEAEDLWSVVEYPPEGLSIDFVRAERSTFRWGGGDHRRIESSGGGVHVLEDAGHWVHSDNPEGLVEIMRPSFSNRT